LFRVSLGRTAGRPRLQQLSEPVCLFGRGMPDRDGRIGTSASGTVKEERCTLPKAGHEGCEHGGLDGAPAPVCSQPPPTFGVGALTAVVSRATHLR